MASKNWKDYVTGVGRLLAAVSVRDRAGKELGPDQGFAIWSLMTTEARQLRKTIFLIGNGASASMASHLAADLAKNGQLRTEVFTDLSLITAISNDLGFDQIFSEPLRRRASRGDLLVAISSSGRSPNILRAVELAHSLDLPLITLSAMDPDNPLRQAGDLNFHVGATTYGQAETCHAAILHHWMDLVEIRDSKIR